MIPGKIPEGAWTGQRDVMQISLTGPRAVCAECGAPPTDEFPLLKCGNEKCDVHYCCRAHMAAGWARGHKESCGKHPPPDVNARHTVDADDEEKDDEEVVAEVVEEVVPGRDGRGREGAERTGGSTGNREIHEMRGIGLRCRGDVGVNPSEGGG